MTSEIIGRVLKDRRTKNLTRRLRPGDIALIYHADLDITSAYNLVECHVAAVVNAQKSITGRYPNGGPTVLLDAGIPLYDEAGFEAFSAIPEGSSCKIVGGALHYGNGKSVPARLLTRDVVEAELAEARKNLHVELDHFARNTLEHLANEEWLLYDPVETPALKTQFNDRHVMIVVRGHGYKEDLAMLGEYLRDVRPVLVGVDGGADALLEARLQPHVILGDMDSVSDTALTCGAELVVHGYPRGDSRGVPGMERVDALGIHASVLHSAGTSEDVAMLLADALGARLIVAVGTHFSLEEFMDKGRNGMASTFLTRLRIGSRLVDAKGIARLYEGQRIRLRDFALILLAAACPIVAVIFITNPGRAILQFVEVWLRYHFH